MLSTTTLVQRGKTSWAISALDGMMAPPALMWAPGATMDENRNGSLARVKVVMMGASLTAASAEAQSRTSKSYLDFSRATNWARFSAVGLNTRTRLRSRTVATAATWGNA